MAATTTNFVTLTNAAIQESGTDLASFATNGSDFGTNTDAMLQRFKLWVARAWKDIQMQTYDWDFMEEQALVNLDPGIMVYSNGCKFSDLAILGNTPFSKIWDQDQTVAVPSITISSITDLTGTSTLTAPFGYFTLGTSSTSPLAFGLKPAAEYITSIASGVGTSFAIGVSTTSLGGGSYKIFVPMDGSGNPTIRFAIGDYAYNTDQTNYIMGQVTAIGTAPASITVAASTIVGTPASISPGHVGGFGPLVAYVHSWKSFNFNEETSIGEIQESINEIDNNSFRAIDYYKGAPSGETPLKFVPWSSFRDTYDLSNSFPGFPQLISEDDTGRWRLYPHPYYKVSVKFDYDRLPQNLSAYNDVPKNLEDEFIDIIMWKALIYYGEYDEDPSTVQRATKNYKTLLSRFELRDRGKFYLLPKRLY